ncbi:V-type ATPase subunit [[Eubacterium] cellulosolvens]
MPRADQYAYSTTYVRALRSRLLSADLYEDLLKTKDEHDVIRLLADTSYSNNLFTQSGKQFDISTLDSVIFEDYYRVLQELINMKTTDKANQIFEIILKRHEFSCLKMIIRLVFSRTPSEESAQLISPIGRYTTEYIRKLLKSKDLHQLFSNISDLKIREMSLKILPECEEKNSTLPIEMLGDRFYLDSLWNIVKNLENLDKDATRDIIGTEIDITNINLILRGKNLGVNFSTLSDLVIPIQYRLNEKFHTALEAATTNEAMHVLSTGQYREAISKVIVECESKQTLLPLEITLKRLLVERCSKTFLGYPFGVGPIIAFLYLKFFEGMDVRTIIMGKRERIQASILHRLLLSTPRWNSQ